MTKPRTTTVAALRALLADLPDDLPVLLGYLWGSDEEGGDVATCWEPKAEQRLVGAFGASAEERVPCLVLTPTDDRPDSHTIF